MFPGAGVDAFRRAQEVRGFAAQSPSVAESSAANARVDDLVAGLRPPEVAAAVPVAAPEPAPEAAPEAAPKPQFQSRYRPMLEQKQAELEQLTAQRDALTAQGRPVDANITYGIQIKSGVVSKLKAMVDAEEAAVVDAESLSVLERQTNRLTREEELVKQARKRAPGDALIAFGNALAGAKAGEKFASVLTRGLVAGNESYTNARNAGEESRRTIEEKRDALIMKNRELIEKARADAINRANSGAVMTEAEMRLANLNQEGVDKLAEAPLKLQKLKAETTIAETTARFAPQVAAADLAFTNARTVDALRPPTSSGGAGGTGTLSPTQAFNRANAARVRLEKLEKRIIEADGKGDVAATEQLLNQYKSDRDAYNQNAPGAGLAPITIRGFPVKLPKYEAYVKKKGRHPSGKTTQQYDLSEALNKYGG
jgi:hypothetical protein